ATTCFRSSFRPTLARGSELPPRAPPAARKENSNSLGEAMPDSRSVDTTSTFATKGVRVQRRYTEPGVHPFDAIDWELRDAEVGKFKQEKVEFPKSWSQNATNIVAQKYFRGQMGSDGRDSSV